MSFNDFKKIRETTGGAKGTPTAKPTPVKVDPAPDQDLEVARPLDTQDS